MPRIIAEIIKAIQRLFLAIIIRRAREMKNTRSRGAFIMCGKEIGDIIFLEEKQQSKV